MKYGIWDNTGPRQGVSTREVYRQHLDELAVAEAGGFDHYWFYEHHLSPTAPMPAPNLMIARAAERPRLCLARETFIAPTRSRRSRLRLPVRRDAARDGRGIDARLRRRGHAARRRGVARAPAAADA